MKAVDKFKTGEKIRSLILCCYNTIGQFSRETEIPLATVQGWTSGKNMPSLSSAVFLCETLLVPIEELIVMEEE